MGKIKVTLVRSTNGKHKKNKKIVEALGLRKIGDTNEFEKNGAVDGMIRKVSYLIKVEEAK